jgi:hypothetical protein
MDQFLRIIKNLLFALGVDIDRKFQAQVRVQRAFLAWRATVFSMMVLSMVQILYDIRTTEAKGIVYCLTVYEAIILAQGIFNFILVMTRIREIFTLCKKLKNFYADNYGALEKKQEKKMAAIFGFLIIGFIVLVLSGEINILLSVTKVTKSHLIKGVPLDEIEVPQSFWPFHARFYLPWTFPYMSVYVIIKVCAVTVIHQLFMMSAVQLSFCFDKLGDEVKEVIDGSLTRAFRDTKEMLAKCVDRHCQLIEFYNEISALFGPSLLALIAQASLLICMLGFSVYVSTEMHCYENFPSLSSHPSFRHKSNQSRLIC